MKKIRLITIALALVFISCNENKKSSEKEIEEVSKIEKKGNLIDGSWELNYMASTAKSLDSLFTEKKPGFKIETENGKISGFSGCNNFNGNLSIDAKKFDVDDKLAVTRKMCPDMAGEDLFLKNLQKISSYSLSNNGQTLNLISDDMAIMRLERKDSAQ